MRLSSVLSYFVISLSLVSSSPLPLLPPTSSTSSPRPGAADEQVAGNTTSRDSVVRTNTTFSAIPKSNTLPHYRSYQRRGISAKTTGKIAATAAFLGLVTWGFVQSGEYVKTVNAGPGEGAFTTQQEHVVKMWFEHEPTQLWEGDQAMQRIRDAPNVSQDEIDMFENAWKARQVVILAQTASGKLASNSSTTTLVQNGSSSGSVAGPRGTSIMAAGPTPSAAQANAAASQDGSLPTGVATSGILTRRNQKFSHR